MKGKLIAVAVAVVLLLGYGFRYWYTRPPQFIDHVAPSEVAKLEIVWLDEMPVGSTGYLLRFSSLRAQPDGTICLRRNQPLWVQDSYLMSARVEHRQDGYYVTVHNCVEKVWFAIFGIGPLELSTGANIPVRLAY